MQRSREMRKKEATQFDSVAEEAERLNLNDWLDNDIKPNELKGEIPKPVAHDTEVEGGVK